MRLLKASDLDIAKKPELVIGLTAAVGAPLLHVQRRITSELQDRGYQVRDVRMSNLIEAVDEPGHEVPPGASEYQRIRHLMKRGGAVREALGGGDALGLLAAAEIAGYRPDNEEFPVLDGHAFLLRQLKHPGEVFALRLIYGDAFHLVGVYSPEPARRHALITNFGMTESEADDLIETDEAEPGDFGQQLRDTFHQADVFIPVPDHSDTAECNAQISRYFSLLFSDQRTGIVTPTRDEYGMYFAYSASLRSGDLSRQVGAAVLKDTGELISVGCNEVPMFGGGQYWCDSQPDGRDAARGGDPNAMIKPEILEELLLVVDPSYDQLGADARDARLRAVVQKLGQSRLMNLTEFGRPVHAEMEALLAAGRIGTSVVNANLYTTTFPCHNCAKHIVGAGVKRVVYIEPYPKSMAIELHGDAMQLTEGSTPPAGKVLLESFCGVAPRRYTSLFAMVMSDGTKYARKKGNGEPLNEVLGLRLRELAFNYMQREAVGALALKHFVASQQQELDLV